MGLRPMSNRVLLAYARPGAFVEKAVAILGRLGYRIIEAEDAPSELQFAGRPELLIADEAHLDLVIGRGAVEAPFDDLPIVLLSGRHGVTHDDPRIIGAIKRPAGLHDLYRLVQQVFEDTPRTTPRVPTDLPVQCDRRGDQFAGSLLSISENGGLLRCDVDLPLGACFAMRLTLPGAGDLEVRAEAAYQLLPDVGVVFSGLAPEARAAIGEFVSGSIMS